MRLTTVTVLALTGAATAVDTAISFADFKNGSKSPSYPPSEP